MSAAESPHRRGRPYDPAARRVLTARPNERGGSVYIPAEVLEDAGLDPTERPIYYRTSGYRRSANGHTVIVSLYREP